MRTEPPCETVTERDTVLILLPVPNHWFGGDGGIKVGGGGGAVGEGQLELPCPFSPGTSHGLMRTYPSTRGTTGVVMTRTYWGKAQHLTINSLAGTEFTDMGKGVMDS